MLVEGQCHESSWVPGAITLVCGELVQKLHHLMQNSHIPGFWPYSGIAKVPNAVLHEMLIPIQKSDRIFSDLRNRLLVDASPRH